MTNYLRADLHRVLHKQSFLGSVGAFSVLFAVLVFIYFNPSFTAEMYVAKVTSFLSFFPLVIGVFVFLSVYADDFKCRSMQVAIGFGMPRSQIILAKLLESALLLLGAAVAVGVLVLCAPAVLGLAPDARQTLSLALTVAAEMLRALGYLALSAVPVFLSQDAAGGVIAYVLLASKSVYIIVCLYYSVSGPGAGSFHRHLRRPDPISLYRAALYGEGRFDRRQDLFPPLRGRPAALYHSSRCRFRGRFPQTGTRVLRRSFP